MKTKINNVVSDSMLGYTIHANGCMIKSGSWMSDTDRARLEFYDRPMVCGHFGRYVMGEDDGTKNCALCVLEATIEAYKKFQSTKGKKRVNKTK